MRYPFSVMKNFRNRSVNAISVFVQACLLPVLLALAAAASLQAAAQAPVPDSPAIEAKSHALLSKLTLEQKITMLGGIDSMYTNAIPSVGLPRFKMSDASVGVRTWGPTTAYAGGVALAATWDPAFSRKLGESLGKDARARSVNFLLGPGVNIARAPVGGRNFEYLSEDPYLNSVLVVPYIQGVQSQGVIATVKHYALNNEEFNRHNASSDVDERTMREIYLPSFEAAVTRGHVDAVMNSYNLINGVHATQNEFLNLKLLKGEWGFKGVLMSDWAATYDGVAAVNNGLDLEMPSPRFMNAETLLPAIKDGSVKESTINDHVLRLFRVMYRYHFLDRPQFDSDDSPYSVADRAVAWQGALDSITLLKNDYVVGVAVTPKEHEAGAYRILSVSENGFGKRTDVEEYRLQSRGGKGVKNMAVTDRIGRVNTIQLVDDTSELMVISQFGKIIRVDTKQIRAAGRATQGVRLLNLEDGDKVAAAVIIPPEELNGNNHDEQGSLLQ